MAFCDISPHGRLHLSGRDNGMLCGKRAVAKCADCGSSICYDCCSNAAGIHSVTVLRLPRDSCLPAEACSTRTTPILKLRFMVLQPTKPVKPPAVNRRATSRNALVVSPQMNWLILKRQ